MNRASNILLSLGTVVALVAGARIPPVTWVVAVGLVIMAGGVALKRLSAGRAGGGEILGRGVPELLNLLVESSSSLDYLKLHAGEMDVNELRVKVDGLLTGPFFLFADGREALRHSFGTGGYNRVMEYFALSERYLNRVWSALIDGYPEEAYDYLARSAEALAVARDTLSELAAGRH